MCGGGGGGGGGGERVGSLGLDILLHESGFSYTCFITKQVQWTQPVSDPTRFWCLGAASLKVLGGILAPKLVYIVLRKELLKL